MNIMVVEEGEGALFFLCQALEALGARIYTAPSMDEDKVLIYKIDAILHLWSEFTSDVERTQIRNLKEAVPTLVVAIFSHAEEISHLRREFKQDLVADLRALDGANAPRTAEALIREVKNRQAQNAAAGTHS